MKFLYLLCLLNICVAGGLRISCGTRGAGTNIVFPDTDLRELRCVCNDPNSAGTFGTERFSSIFNPFLASFDSSSRPVSQKISHIILSNCRNQNINLELDLGNLRSTAARLTDISFENMNQLSVELRGVTQSHTNFIFTDILDTKIRGSLPDISSTVQMFFRQTRGQQSSVTFDRADIQSSLRLLNFQDVADITVSSSYFRQIESLEIRGSRLASKCHDTLDDNFYRTDVECSKQELFYRSSSKPVDPSSSPLTAPITSRPEFLVPVSLLVVVSVAGLVAGLLYIRHQKRENHFGRM